MNKKEAEEFQKKTRELLLAQQSAFLDALKAWQESMSAASTAKWPEPPTAEALVTPSEMAEMSAAFTAKLLADQSKFMQEIGKVLAKQNK